MADTRDTDISTVFIKVTELSSVTSVVKNDVFTIARIGNESTLNYNVEYSVISSLMLENLRHIPEITIQKPYYFNNKNILGIKTANIYAALGLTNPVNNVAINIEFLRKKIIQQIYDLSTYIFDKNNPHVPSHSGQIITTKVHSTAQAMANTFGGLSSEWNKVSAKFIIGVGSNEENTAVEKYGKMKSNAINISLEETGGSTSIKLRENQIPSHTHRFRSTPARFTLTWYMSWINENIKLLEHGCGVQFYSVAANPIQHPSHIGSFSNKFFQVKEGTIASMSATFHGQGTIKPWGGNLTELVYNSNGTVINQTSHNNIPPFIIEYVWRRN